MTKNTLLRNVLARELRGTLKDIRRIFRDMSNEAPPVIMNMGRKVIYTALRSELKELLEAVAKGKQVILRLHYTSAEDIAQLSNGNSNIKVQFWPSDEPPKLKDTVGDLVIGNRTLH